MATFGLSKSGTMILNVTIYLLLAEFSVRTVNYGPSFFSVDLWPKRFDGKNSVRNLQYGPKNEANKMFIIWLLPVLGTGNKCRTHDLTVI